MSGTKTVLVTEKGMAGMDWVSLDGCFHDMQRVDFLKFELEGNA